MSYSNGIISAPVRLRKNNGDIELAVGNTSGDLATCIRYGNINMWAKYKPIRLSSKSTLNYPDWWKGTDGKCGIGIDTFDELGSATSPSQNTFLYLLKNGQLPWTYNRPRGGAYNEPFRMTDFINYNAAARNPFGDIATTDIWLDNNVFRIDYDLEPSDYGLSVSDISVGGKSLAQYYLGLLMWSGNTVICVTSSRQLGTSSISIIIENASSLVGNWRIIPFFSNWEYPIGATYKTGTYFSANITTPILITVHASGTVYDVDSVAYWSATNRITIIPTVSNSSSGQMTVGNIYTEIRTNNGSMHPEDDSTFVDGTAISWGSVTVPGNSSVTLSARTITVAKNSSLTYWILSTAAGATAIYNQIDEDGPMAD